MQGRNVLILIVAVVIGLLAVVLANAWFSGVEQRQIKQAEQQKLARIVVATQPLEFGTRLTEQNVRLQNWPAASVPEGAFTAIPEALKDDRTALRPIVPGEPVLASKVSGKDGRATLAAVLPNGMHAYSIPSSALEGVSGFVLPGTMVDVLLTRKIPGDGAQAEDMRADVILRNVQVLAVDQLASDKKGDPKVARTATVAVTLADAQRLSIAEKIGTLSLALRKVEDGTGVNAAYADATSTVTNRQLGGARIFIGKRPEMAAASPMPMAALASAARAFRGGAQGMGAHSGSSMTVVRGVEPTIYPLGGGIPGGK